MWPRQGPLPGFSAIRVRSPLTCQSYPFTSGVKAGKALTLTTGSAPQHGEFALEFSPLEPGHYLVEGRGAGRVD